MYECVHVRVCVHFYGAFHVSLCACRCTGMWVEGFEQNKPLVGTMAGYVIRPTYTLSYYPYREFPLKFRAYTGCPKKRSGGFSELCNKKIRMFWFHWKKKKSSAEKNHTKIIEFNDLVSYFSLEDVLSEVAKTRDTLGLQSTENPLFSFFWDTLYRRSHKKLPCQYFEDLLSPFEWDWVWNITQPMAIYPSRSPVIADAQTHRLPRLLNSKE